MLNVLHSSLRFRGGSIANPCGPIGICSRLHLRLMTKEFERVALSRFDDKRYMCTDGKRTLAYGSIEISAICDLSKYYLLY